ncbi:hypothetical protein SLEP1_g20360 [Rubroshorea leprosula]|uniref:Uncharacterized protein n=1 Tax=Rubroshorea leprosula TaxID=152421 RepID=A0AAV5JBF7_9ROSI|nr:hypothetical protein SLEP1_g20360 [Rubroshorea leprosula]
MSYTSLCFSLFFVIFSVVSSRYFSANDNFAVPYQYLKLVLQWQPSVCSVPRVNCPVPPSPNFTIHGLWPSNYSDRYSQPSYCTKEQFNLSQLPRNLQQDMYAYWPDVIRNQSEKFWEHEWAQHGTCSVMTQKYYFNFTVTTTKDQKYNLLSFLEEEGISPNNSRTVDTRLVKAAIEKHIKKHPGLRCVPKKGQGGQYQLNEVVLCFNETKVLIDCVDSYDSNCRGPILFSE